MDTLQRVWKVLDRWCDLPSETIDPHLSFESLQLDSLVTMEIGFGLDKEFNTSIPDSEILRAKTVSDLVDVIDAALLTP